MDREAWLQTTGLQRVGYNWVTECTHTHTHIYVERINNQVLLYSIRNYIQYPVINHNGKECEIECIHTYN